MADASVHGHSLQSPRGKFIVHTTGEADDTRVRSLFPFRGQMSRHFISTVICISVLLVSASLSISINAAPRQQPSFDCRKAAAASEKAICANVTLSRLDFQLGRTWQTLLRDFDTDSVQETQMKQDQRAWIVRRTTCGDDANCIGKLYRDRLSALDGTDPVHRFSGEYDVKDVGLFALYPIGGRYLVHVQTADPREGAWECDLSGEATSSGDDLEVSIEGSTFQAHLQDAETLVVRDSDSVHVAASKFCGVNGTFAFTYLRVRLDVAAKTSHLQP
jgi:uncharacterized protein